MTLSLYVVLKNYRECPDSGKKGTALSSCHMHDTRSVSHSLLRALYSTLENDSFHTKFQKYLKKICSPMGSMWSKSAANHLIKFNLFVNFEFSRGYKRRWCNQTLLTWQHPTCEHSKYLYNSLTTSHKQTTLFKNLTKNILVPFET